MNISAKLATLFGAFMMVVVLVGAPAKTQAADLSNAEVKLVQESWALIEQRIPSTVERFYRRYFQLDPAAKELFNEKTMKVQLDAFSNILSDVAAGADDLDQFANRFRRLGALHQNFGAQPHQISLFGVAFVDTLRLELKGEFKPRARTAWNKIFYDITKMMEAGYEE